MKKGWIYKGWETDKGELHIYPTKGTILEWLKSEWPPVKVVILTEEEYRALLVAVRKKKDEEIVKYWKEKKA